MIDDQQRMYMAAHDSTAREFADRGVSEQSAYEQPSQHQASLHTQRLSREHGQQHALIPNQAPGPVSPSTPPTRSQEVRVQCEAPDCQALLQVSIPLTQPVRQAVIVRCGGCSRLLEVELAAALEHLEQQRQESRSLPQAEYAPANQYPLHPPQIQYSQASQELHPYPPPTHQHSRLSTEQLASSPSLHTQPYALIPPVYQPSGHGQASQAGQPWGQHAADLQTQVQRLPDTPRAVSTSPVHHHITPVSFSATNPAPYAPPTDLQTPRASSDPVQAARPDPYSGYDQYGRRFVDHRPPASVPNPFSVNPPHPYAATPPPQYVSYQLPPPTYHQTQIAPHYLNPSIPPNAPPYPPVHYTEPHAHSVQPHPQNSHAPYYLHQTPDPPHARLTPVLPAAVHPQHPPAYPHHHHQQPYYEVQPPHHDRMGIQHAEVPPTGTTDPATESGSSVGHDAEGPTQGKKRKDRSMKEPTPYNMFVRDEIARLKESRPDINHKEAFATAAANWQYAPNNNGRVKKSRLKKEAEAAAAQPESCKATESQQSPTKPVCIPLNAHADRHLLKWPPSIAPRSRQTTASAEAKEAVGSRKSAHAEEQAAELQQPALHKTSVGEDAHAEAQADVGTIAQTVAWSKQRSSGCTEHRKLLSQGLLDLTESIRTSPDARDGAAVQQSSPEPKSKAVCHSAQPDQPLQHSLHSPEQQSYSLIGPVTQPDQSRQSSPAKQQSPVRSSPDRSAGQEDFSLTAISHTRSPTEPVTGMPAISERNASPTASEDATLPASSLVAADASNRQLAASDRVALHEASPGTGRKATTAAQDVTLGSHSAEPEASDAAATNAQPLSSCAAATISAPAAAPAAEQTVSPQAKPALTRLPSGAAELSRAGVDPCSPQSVLLLEKATRAKLTQTSASVPSGVNEIVHASSDMQAQRSRHMLNLTPEQLALLADRALIGASLLAKDALNIPENHDSTAIHLQSVQGRQQTDTTAMPLPVNRSPVHNDTRI